MNYFLRIEVSKTATSLYLSQAKYIADLLTKHDMADYSQVLTLMSIGYNLTKRARPTISNASQYRNVIRALQYVTLTQSKIAFSVNKLSMLLSSPTTEH